MLSFVFAHQQPSRLDKFLARELSLSRNEVSKLLSSGAVAVNQQKVFEKAKGWLLEPGTSITVDELMLERSMLITANPDLKLSILKEAEGFIVVDKPAGLPVMPLNAKETNTVLNAVVTNFPEIQGLGEGGLKSGIVHRLDTETSGALLIARSEPGWQELRKAFQRRAVAKTYRAIVQGSLAGANRETMNLVIAKHKPAFVKVTIEKTNAVRQCSLTWRALEPLEAATLIEVNLETGFLHQIRVMMAQLGHSVLGDRLYGNDPFPTQIPRQMLHASSLKLKGIEAYSPDPADFSAVLAQRRNE